MESEKIIAIIVSYNPNVTSLKKNIEQINGPSMRIVLVDNGSNHFVLESIKGIADGIENVECYLLPNNIGIGGAQNFALDKVMEEEKSGEETVCFFDQDSFLEYGDILKMKKAFAISERDNVAVIGPSTGIEQEEGIVKSTEIISSGSFSKLKYFTDDYVGKFMSELFIDFIDYEWCWRAENKGFFVATNTDVAMHHQTNGELEKKFGKQVTPASRLYFVFRNLIISLRVTHASMGKRIIWSSRALKTIFFQALVAKKRKEALKKIFVGIFDGVTYAPDTAIESSKIGRK